MFGFKSFHLTFFFMFNIISTGCAEEKFVEMLKKKVILLDESLTMDIRLLRQDIRKNAEEFNRLSDLLDETLVTLNKGETRQDVQPASQTRQLDVLQDVERANHRLKRAFAAEKYGLKKFTSQMKNEINYLANNINTSLSDFRISNVEARRKVINNLDSFKTAITNDLSEVMANLGKDLTMSVKSMSTELAQETSEVVASMEKMSQNVEMVPVIKKMVRAISNNRLKTPFATSGQVNQIKEELSAFEDRFGEMDKMLSKLRKQNMKIYTKGNIGLENVTRTLSTIGGRLTLRYNDTWGTVIYLSPWEGQKTANIACRMLGFSSPYAYSNDYLSRSLRNRKAFAGYGIGTVWELNSYKRCSGAEDSLFDCPGVYGPGSSYQHQYDIGLICNY